MYDYVCYIPDFYMAFVVCEFMVVLFVCIYLLLIREYIYENCYALEFMMWKFYELSEKSELKIAR